MQEQGGELIKHYRDLAFMGFAEVLMNLKTIFRNLAFCKTNIEEYEPDCLVLIDYPGFNLRMAKWAKKKRLKVIYYISPQVWAWKKNRVKMMKQCIDKMLVILPFEKDYFKDKWNWEVEYVGHPLVEVIETHLSSATRQKISEKPIIAVLPGSRKQEITKKLPVMLEVSNSFPEYQFIVAKAPGISEEFYCELLGNYPNVSWVGNKTYDLLMQAKAALVTSGTATLETALFGIPEVVCYKASPLTYQIAKKIVKIKYISLVNLIMNKLVVKELIQNNFTTINVTTELRSLLTDKAKQDQIKKDYNSLKQLLYKESNASEKAAISIIEFLSGK